MLITLWVPVPVLLIVTVPSPLLKVPPVWVQLPPMVKACALLDTKSVPDAKDKSPFTVKLAEVEKVADPLLLKVKFRKAEAPGVIETVPDVAFSVTTPEVPALKVPVLVQAPPTNMVDIELPEMVRVPALFRKPATVRSAFEVKVIVEADELVRLRQVALTSITGAFPTLVRLTPTVLVGTEFGVQFSGLLQRPPVCEPFQLANT